MAKKKRSIEIPLQTKSKCPICDNHIGLYYIPYGDEAIEKSKEFTLYQVLESKIWGTKKERSLIQLNLYWACCHQVAILTSDHENIFDRKDIDFQVKIDVAKKKPELIRRFILRNGMTYIEPISTSIANMKHLEACKYYDLAYKEFSKMVGMDKDELIALTKSNMVRR